MHCESKSFTIGEFFIEKNAINLSPEYQRVSNAWGETTKQLFLDSLFNKYDVPKIYLHALKPNGGLHVYSLVDGNQRLHCIWEFLDGKIALSEEFEIKPNTPTMRKDTPYPKPGNTYKDLSDSWKERFKGIQLAVVIINDADDGNIEEIFSRLNSGEPLNAAEKRNAFGGDMCTLIRDMSKHKFFTTKVFFNDKRYLYYDIVTRFLLIEDGINGSSYPYCDLKKKFLDKLVRDNKAMRPSRKKELKGKVEKQLNSLVKVFDDKDERLKRAGYLQLYYLFIKEMERLYADAKLLSHIKEFIINFTKERAEALDKPPEQKIGERYSFLDEFERLMQQGNDEKSLKKRVNTMRQFFLEEYPKTKIRDPKRNFTEEERYVIYIRAQKTCEECKKSFKTFDEFEADHVIQWAHGGSTSLENAQALCKKCNSKKNSKVA